MKTLRRWLPLFLVSALGLFMELAVIRWLSGEIRLMAYIKNLALLAAFLGFAVGFAIVGKGRDYRFSFPMLWVLLVAVTLAVGKVDAGHALIFPGSADVHLWFVRPAPFWSSLLVFVAMVGIFFVSTLLLFIPLGQMTGEEMAKYPPVPAYVVNILASLAGVWAFSLLSLLNTPPVVWFGVALVGLAAYYVYVGKRSWLTWGLFAASLVAIAIFNGKALWSPYNRLDISPGYYSRQSDGQQVTLGYLLNVQGAFYQHALNHSTEFIQSLKGHPGDAGMADEMTRSAFLSDLPYLVTPNKDQVLVVGAGMGNDVAAALRNGAGRVDAVEIDPVILELGRQLHPEQPYSDPRVNPIVDDARSFFNKSQNHYNLVVFGLLDSQTLLSGMSSVRLDSFVYTLDSFRQVKRILAPDGVIAIAFSEKDWIQDRLGRMLKAVFPDKPLHVYPSEYTTILVAGPVVENDALVQMSVWQPNPAYNDLPLTTDDWPYLYQRARKIPDGYWQAILFIALISLVMLYRSFREALRPDWHFWLLGAAFLLIEFKSITELALLFGTTWFVNSLAISGVLLMALCANLVVLRVKRVNLGWAYAGLFVCLALSYFFPLSWLGGLPGALKAVVSTLLLSLPLFFSGLIFSESLRRAGETARPLSSNFSGSAVGGLLEYGSSVWGIKSLYGLAALIYLGALFTAFRRGRKG